MICRLLGHEIALLCRSVLRFLDRSVCRAMGCFVGCFRVRDDRSRTHLVSRSTRSNKSTEVVVSRNRLSSLFLSEENEESLSSDKGTICLDSVQIDKGLKDEAKFLKACGTIPETPIEIRKAFDKLKISPTCDTDSEISVSHSNIHNRSTKKFDTDAHLVQPITPIKLGEERGRESLSSEHSPHSCISSVQNSGISSGEGSEKGSVDAKLRDQTNKNVDFTPPAANVQGKNRSVRFECDSDVSFFKDSSEYVKQSTKKTESPGISKSPNLTPLKLSDEMQTPGTIFPTSLEALGNGKTRIRSQYVYSVMNPIENMSQLKVLKEEDSHSIQIVGDLQHPTEKTEGKTPGSEVVVKEITATNELKVEASLSSWLKPQPSACDDQNQNIGAISSRVPPFGRTPGDRPIIGMVAAHWKDDESSHVAHKWWDGNGIPNSTNKYKEDQKVSWHATPFEERLEKALSDESLITQRKHISHTPVAFDAEECDTASSQLRPSTNSKSVVSF